MGYLTWKRSSLSPQAVHVQTSSLAPSSPNGPEDRTDDVRRSACAPQAGQGWPGLVGGGNCRALSSAARRVSSASKRAGRAFKVFQTGI